MEQELWMEQVPQMDRVTQMEWESWMERVPQMKWESWMERVPQVVRLRVSALVVAMT
jgi:hypothetical protein